MSAPRCGTTTAFIVDGADYYVALLDNEGIRVGSIAAGVAFDFPPDHATFTRAVVLTTEEEVEALHDECCSKSLHGARS